MGYGKLIAFAGGALATGVLNVASKSPRVRGAMVNCVAKGMQFKAEADEALQNIKDDAEDVCADARYEARVKAAMDARRAEVEERIRAEVEAQMAEEAALAEAALAAEEAAAK
ncbi:MAG: DUF1490 domain-containing protein [Coriobacteriia bacterium]|nr:DUF1490 domain-containing protein [Coriobacteriia bacterium]